MKTRLLVAAALAAAAAGTATPALASCVGQSGSTRVCVVEDRPGCVSVDIPNHGHFWTVFCQ